MQDQMVEKLNHAHGDIRSRERDYNTTVWKLPHLMDLNYIELEDKNLELKGERRSGMSSDDMRERFTTYLKEERGIKAITVFFSDLEGRLHALDYDKKHLIDSEDNLTFDGSSIRGFTAQKESDLRLKLDWTSLRFSPSDLFGAGKVMIFANVCDKDGSLYSGDFRSQLMKLMAELNAKGITVNVAPEIEGFLFKGNKAEQSFDEKAGFELATMSGYYNSLPHDTLRVFIDKFAETQRALGFENEKDHPEVAPAQFELNFKYTGALDTTDQIQLYKLLARQVASSMGMTASFLPKPVQGINGTGMHTNISLSQKGKNLFYDKKGKHSLSAMAYRFITGILYRGMETCLILNSSVNSYRRLDPAYEAPNQIKMSSTDRGSMIRIPIGNENSSRIEVRTVAPDANPYLCYYTLIKAGLEGMQATPAQLKKMEAAVYKAEPAMLPSDIYKALEHFEKSDFMKRVMGADNHRKYAALKRMAADRSPKNLGTRVKSSEVLYHHDVTNQLLWAGF